jgi:cytochrome P450
MFEFDPFDAAYFADPYPYYARMRDEFPVYKHATAEQRVWPHYWMISRAADVEAALKDWQTFSSATGTLIDTDISLLPPNMFNMDPPRHDELRAPLTRVMTPTRVAALEPHIRASVEELVDGFMDERHFDASTDFAHHIPVTTMCTLFDLPTSERAQFLKWNLDTLGGADFTSEAALGAYGEMAQYWVQIVADRRGRTGSDLLSQIINASLEEGKDMSDEEIAGYCSLMHDAAQNTTMNTICHSAMVLARHPDQRRALLENPALIDGAVEELLRFISPVQGLARSTTRDVVVAGTTIPEGDQVLILYGSANHDPAAFADPETFDISRKGSRAHWAFGHGIHFCLGHALAKLEIKVAVQVLCERLGEWELDESGVELNQLVPTRGVAHAPISF